MKLRYNTVDIVAAVAELKASVIGMRFNQVYDIDNKTYLFRLNRQDEKVVLLVESGVRIHRTDFEWPKNSAPSGFTMKLRKHLKNKRLESLTQLGDDRILDLQFGSGEVAHHVIVELYDKGNLVLTDWQYLILNVLRPRIVGGEDGKLVVRETYPVNAAKRRQALPSVEELVILISSAKVGDNIRKVLNPHFIYGPAVIDHVLARAGFPRNCRLGKEFDVSVDCERLVQALQEAEEVLQEASEQSCKGFVVQKVTRVTLPGGEEKESRTFEEFHPFLYEQHRGGAYIEFDTFNRAVDNFFSSLESQRIDSRTAQKEREALKKLDNVKQDHDKRVKALQEDQKEDVHKAELVENNLELVDKAILVVRSAIASQIGWANIADLVEEARAVGDPVAGSIKTLHLDKNHISMVLKDPYTEGSEGSLVEIVAIDLDLSAYANARKFYDKKRHAVKKEQKTLESSEKAYRNAEKRTKQTLKEVAVTSAIVKARKNFWFEKFLWFVTSENYLVIGGRDIQQNEMLVRRYLKKGDLYVHADLHGASSIVVKNPSGNPVPPKTLNDAGTMALCYSSAWEAKVVTSAWWVHNHQVSKTAPTGEYLTPGSFMIRGKKNFLPPSHLVVGFGFLFKVDEDSVERHKNERRIIHGDEVGEVEDSAEEEIIIQEESDHEPEEESAILPKPDGQEEGSDDISFPDTVVQHRILQPASETTSAPEKDLVTRQISKRTSHRPQNDIETERHALKESEAKKGPKRGQRSKMKKIKEKYSDQDEEERRLRMEILASAGEKKTTPKKTVKTAIKPKVIAPRLPPKPEPEVKPKDDSDHEQQPEEEAPSNEDEATLCTLTGCPVAEDTLIFAVPVCAPYAAMVNYKYKVKVMPGTGKRGKASKSALAAFMHDRMATSREKDLLRSVKDQDISRNLPGKVKMVVAKKR